MRDLGPPFVLAFDNELGCACGNELLEGDPGGYIDGELACEECWEEARRYKTMIVVKGDNITLGKEE